MYFRKIQEGGIRPPNDYLELVSYESKRIADLSVKLKSLDGVEYIDLVQILQDTALRNRPLYPDSNNGHPVSYGYSVIGKHIAPLVASMLPLVPEGQIAIKNEIGKYLPYVITNDTALLFGSDIVFEGNGWSDKVFKPVSARDMAVFPKKIIDEIDMSRYGPKALSGATTR